MRASHWRISVRSILLTISLGAVAGCPSTRMQPAYGVVGTAPSSPQTSASPVPTPSPSALPIPLPLEHALYTATFAGEDLARGAELPIQANGSQGAVTIRLVVTSEFIRAHEGGLFSMLTILPDGKTIRINVNVTFTDTPINGTVTTTVKFVVDPQSPELKAAIGIVINL